MISEWALQQQRPADVGLLSSYDKKERKTDSSSGDRKNWTGLKINASTKTATEENWFIVLQWSSCLLEICPIATV